MVTPDPISEWSQDEISSWINGLDIGLDRYKESLKYLTGDQLLTAKYTDLYQYGIDKGSVHFFPKYFNPYWQILENSSNFFTAHDTARFLVQKFWKSDPYKFHGYLRFGWVFPKIRDKTSSRNWLFLFLNREKLDIKKLFSMQFYYWTIQFGKYDLVL